MEDLAIYASGLRKAYRSGSTSTQVLGGVDLEVRRGECIYLAGPSGSGKSTLLSILGCVLTTDSGHVELLGRDVTRLERDQQADFRARNIGFVFQRFHLFSGLSTLENVRIPLSLLGRPPQAAKQRALQLLDAVGLLHKASSRVTRLSVGQRQRVALARALAADPAIILADEPTASLDAHSGISAMKLLRDLAKSENKTVVVVTHDSRIFPLADRILHLQDGRIEAETHSDPQPDSHPAPMPIGVPAGSLPASAPAAAP